MKIEVGKFYKTRDGRKVGPMKYDGTYAYGDVFSYDGSYWWFTGKVDFDSTDLPDDLIAECIDAPEVGTLQEIGAKEGDTIIYVGDDATPTNKTRIYRGLVNGIHYADEQDWVGVISLNETGPWRIISRAQTKPEQAGPVRTVTRTTREIVPGVYGVVEVYNDIDHGFTVACRDCMKTARDLTSAIETLTAIRDALKENGE